MKVSLKGLRLTEKGEAVLIAIDNGLCIKTEKGFDTLNFERFWEQYEPIKNRNRRKILFLGALFGGLFTRLIDFLSTLL